VPKDHDPHAQTRNQVIIERRKIHAFFQPELDRTLARLRQLQIDSAPIVGENWDAPVLRSFIKRAAAHFKWDWRLEWVIHSLRHGSAQTAIMAGESIQGFTGQASAGVAAHYGRSNDDRVQSLQKQRDVAAPTKAGTAALVAVLQQPVQTRQQVLETVSSTSAVGNWLLEFRLRESGALRRPRDE
jgi:hypothetical protein